ncbi:MAG: hypothetical protein MHM6MM_006462 [Cercozoa sp. M6MM]
MHERPLLAVCNDGILDEMQRYVLILLQRRGASVVRLPNLASYRDDREGVRYRRDRRVAVRSLRDALHRAMSIGDEPLLVVVGGKGTLNAAIDLLGTACMDETCTTPAIAILPAGAQNEMARLFGWRSCIPSNRQELSAVFSRLSRAPYRTVKCDRWWVESHPLGISNGVPENSEFFERPRVTAAAVSPCHFLCAVSVGFLADQMARLSLHRRDLMSEQRSDFRPPFDSGIPPTSALTWRAQGKAKLRNYNKGRVRGLFVLSVPLLRGDVDLTAARTGNTEWLHKPHAGDGVLEVVAVSNFSNLVGRSLFGSPSVHVVGQGRRVTLVLEEALPVEVDGEARLQPPSRLSISHAGELKVVRGPFVPNSNGLDLDDRQVDVLQPTDGTETLVGLYSRSGVQELPLHSRVGDDATVENDDTGQGLRCRMQMRHLAADS